MSTRTYMTFMIGLMVNAVFFGIGAITVLSIPQLAVNAKYLIPAVVVASFAITPFVAWALAPMLRLRYGQKQS